MERGLQPCRGRLPPVPHFPGPLRRETIPCTTRGGFAYRAAAAGRAGIVRAEASMPKKEKPLWRRLLAIDRVLRKGGHVTCGTILELPECEGYNRKTVLRDVEYLRDTLKGAGCAGA